MSTTTCCPAAIPTRPSPWRRTIEQVAKQVATHVAEPVSERAVRALRAWREARRQRREWAALANLGDATRRDLGLPERGAAAPTGAHPLDALRGPWA